MALLRSGLIAAVAATVLMLARTQLLAPLLAGLAMCGLASADLIPIDRGEVEPKPFSYVAGTERYGAVDWLIEHHSDDRFSVDPRGPFRLLNVGLTYNLQEAAGYDSVSIWRVVNYFYLLNHGVPYPHLQLRDDLAATAIERYGSPLVDLANVRYAVAVVPPAAGWVERFRLSGSLHARAEPTWDPSLRVYENPHVMPRAFVVYSADVLSSDAAQLSALAKLDPRRRAIVDRLPTPKPIGDGRPFTPAKLVRAEYDRLVIDADAAAGGLLVVSESFYPGWSAKVDGESVPLLRADYAFRGVAIKAGHHRVEMRFVSRPTEIGLALSALGFFAMLGMGLWRRK